MPGSEHETLPLPEPGQRWVLADTARPERRRRVWPWIVALLVVAGLLVGAWFAGEWLARDIVERAIRTQVVQQLDLAADQQVDVEVGGAVLPGLIVGELDEVRIAAEDVSFDAFAGDVEVVARAVPIRGEQDLGSASATVVVDEDQLRTLLAGVEGFPADTIAIEGSEVTATIELSLFGAAFPIGVGFDIAAATGDLVLTPSSLRLGDADVGADELRARFGGIADAVLRSWDVCVAESLPQALTLTDVQVSEGRVVALVDIAPGIMNDPQLRDPGSCA
ncbi:MAG: DUF2993 domain-containing protein [Microbacterium sp.]|uniref:LmeA family phospholipid-binding protein n=1 Tax=unclassified Microbacterium TaxID=2609290 RepID=UPI000DB16BDA|nr:DUF2993 domain-containing protein [Microbacterium sp.]PZU40950.1 MAG: DUF2993 domain-containing protein [Microbacterium sp.]